MVIFLNRYFHPDHSATSQMLSDLAFDLSGRGHAVRVITSRQGYEDPMERLPSYEVVGGVEVRRMWTSSFGRAKLVGRAVDYVTFYFSAAWTLLSLTGTGDVVVAMTDPPLLSVVAALIARLRGASLVNWLHDLFPEVAQAIGLDQRQLPRFVYFGLCALRSASLRSAAINVTLGDLMAQKIAALGIEPERIVIIPNWADGTLIKPVAPKDNPLRLEWGLEGKFVVGYSGNLGRAHDTQTFLDAITLLEREAPDAGIRWLFIGGGARRDALVKETRARGLATVQFRPYQPRTLLPYSLSAADLHLVSLKPELEGLIVPSKFYGVIAAGRPVIFVGHPEGELARLIQRDSLGSVSPQGDGQALASLVLAFSKDRCRCAAIGAAAREIFLREFDKRAAVDRWEKLLTKLGG